MKEKQQQQQVPTKATNSVSDVDDLVTIDRTVTPKAESLIKAKQELKVKYKFHNLGSKELFKKPQGLSDQRLPAHDTNHDNVKGRLKTCIKFWEHMGANKAILQVISEGYRIPLLSRPERKVFSNN